VPSPLHVSLKSGIQKLVGFFIVERDDGVLYSDEDHAKALAFTLLASAQIESFVEARCVAIAKISISRLKTGQATAGGRALVTWHVVRKLSDALPIHEDDIHSLTQFADPALESFTANVKNSHGINQDDLIKLTYPIGLRDADVPDRLKVNLVTLAERRNPASHTYVNRARSLRQPKDEQILVDQILEDLEVVDDALEAASKAFPRR
jgi:hypothetical protein